LSGFFVAQNRPQKVSAVCRKGGLPRLKYESTAPTVRGKTEMKKDNENGYTCSLFQTGEYLGCRKSLEYNVLGLKYKKRKSVRAAVLTPVLRELPEIRNQETEDFKALVRSRVETLYTEELQEIKTGLKEERELFLQKLFRLFDYFLKVTEGCSVTFFEPFEADSNEIFNGDISRVKDFAHFVYEKDGKRTAVRICDGTNKTSPAARTNENKPKYQASLALMYLGLAEKGETLTCEEWYLNSKKDKKEILADKYENKKGECIASYAYTSNAEAEDAIAMASMCAKKDCDSCRHKAVCSEQRPPLRLETKVAKELVRRQAKEPTFTESQKKVVLHKEGPMAVVAVPGAGKTTSLVHRLKRLLSEGIEADNILFISFTNKAAGEIRERVEALLPEGSKIPEVKTFNAFGYSILKDNKELLGRTLCLASETAKKALIKECLEAVPKIEGRSYSGATLDYGIIKAALEWMDDIASKGEEWLVNTYKEKLDVKGILRLYKEYEKQFRERNYITFDEQISLALELFREHPELSEAYAKQFTYIMVDEYQDTSREQAELIYAIAKHHNNIVVVGDDDQTIYEWRGGSAEFMLNFKSDFADAEIVFMEDNFRSNDKILESANALIENNGERYRKQLVAHKDAANKPMYYPAANTGTVLALIKALLKKYQPGEICVLSRKNSTLQKLAVEIAGICKVTNPKDYVIDDYVFRMIYDVLSLYRDIHDDVALYRLLTHFGAEVPVKKAKECSLHDNLVRESLLTPVDVTDPDYFYLYEEKENRTSLEEAAYRIFKALKACQYYSTMNDLFNKVCEALDIPAEQLVVSQLRELADFSAFETIAQLHDYMTAMIEFSDTKRVEYTPDKDTLQLMTCHDSKGKEFPCVIIYGVEEYGDSESDKRLLYVAMTRAETNLILLRTDISKVSCLAPIAEEYLLTK